MTGGAFGSIFAQFFHLTAAERKTLLVAGAAGGMAATFGTPVAAVLLAVELLLFEWKPRSFIPVALAARGGACVRPLSPRPVRHRCFPCPRIRLHAGRDGPAAGCVVVGLLGGRALALLTGRSTPRKTHSNAADPLDVVAGASAAWSSASAAISSRAPWASATTSSPRCCKASIALERMLVGCWSSRR